MSKERLAELFMKYLAAEEDYREIIDIVYDLREAGATDDELEWLGYEEYQVDDFVKARTMR